MENSTHRQIIKTVRNFFKTIGSDFGITPPIPRIQTLSKIQFTK